MSNDKLKLVTILTYTVLAVIVFNVFRALRNQYDHVGNVIREMGNETYIEIKYELQDEYGRMPTDEEIVVRYEITNNR